MTPTAKQLLLGMIASLPDTDPTKQQLQSLINSSPTTPVAVDGTADLVIDTGLDYDLKSLFNRGQMAEALLIQAVRELRKFNKSEPTVATTATPAAPAAPVTPQAA